MVQYDVTTPAEYLDALEDDWRRDTLLALRDLLLAHEGVEEDIEYKMLGFRDRQGGICNLNAQKAYVALYVGTADKIDPSGELLEGLDRGKGCIRFRKSNSVADTRIDEFIARTIQLHREGADIGC